MNDPRWEYVQKRYLTKHGSKDHEDGNAKKDTSRKKRKKKKEMESTRIVLVDEDEGLMMVSNEMDRKEIETKSMMDYDPRYRSGSQSRGTWIDVVGTGRAEGTSREDGTSKMKEVDVSMISKHEQKPTMDVHGRGEGDRFLRRKEGSDEKECSPDLSPPRRHVRHDSSPDLSPPRRHVRHDSSPDLSPPRRHVRHDSSPEPPSDLVFPSKRTSESAKEQPSAEHSRRPLESATGIIQGEDLSREIKRKAALEARAFDAADPGITGRGASTVYRDKQGMKMEISAMKKLQDREKQSRVPEWGGGLVQKRMREEKLRELQEVKDGRVSQYSLDENEDDRLRAQSRWGDPLSDKQDHYEYLIEKIGRSIQVPNKLRIPRDIPTHSWLRRKIPPPANRYDILPGRFWDGVDRSNGFEAKYFENIAKQVNKNKKAREWSTADM